MSIRKSFSQYLNRFKLHPVAISSTYEHERIMLELNGKHTDITEAHALITLNPFTVAVNAAVMNESMPPNPLLLILRDETVIGQLPLKKVRGEPAGNLLLHLFESDFPIEEFSWVQRVWYAVLLDLKNKTNRKSRHFVVPSAELLKLFVYTLKPRPVYLVSVAHQNGFDVFPVDILGKIAPELMIISVRSTSPAIQHILGSKKLCASSVPFAMKETVYRFGGHHAGGVLPDHVQDVKFMESQTWKIPVPVFALDVNEFQVEHHFTQGIHTQFVARIVHEYKISDGLRLAHTPWFNGNYFQGKFDSIT